MNEAETELTYIDPALQAASWGVVEGSRIRKQFPISKGRLIGNGQRSTPDKADYVLQYRNRNLAVIEGKKRDLDYTEGVTQAKDYAGRLQVRYTYSTNGLKIYGMDMSAGTEADVLVYPSPDELWAMCYPEPAEGTFEKQTAVLRDQLLSVPFEMSGKFQPRYYQENAVTNVLQAVAENKNRILLTLATGTGKTAIAFQIAWKLFKSRWTLRQAQSPVPEHVEGRCPRILFLADRNILADQAFNAFSAFEEDALVRISPTDIKKKGKVPKNGNVFFTIFQTFMASTGSATKLQPEFTEGDDVIFEAEEITDIEDASGYMYILECVDGSFYTGSTNDLRRRIEQHKSGEGAEHTKCRLPIKLICYEKFDRIDKAFEREKQVQNWSRAKKIALIQGDIERLKKLSSGKKVGELAEPYFGEYPKDFFDFIIIDECHRGGAKDESTWRAILDYFNPAFQLGLTATPKRTINVDTYNYFGEPVYIYSLKQGINDGFLTPFKLREVSTTGDEYVYTSDDTIIEGEIEEGKVYGVEEQNRVIELMDIEAYRVEIFMDLIDQSQKTLVFCASQLHALAIRNLINQQRSLTLSGVEGKSPNYCHRVTADDGKRGEQHLRDFQDNEKIIPTILTTSQKLSTGVDAPEVRNIVLLRPIRTMIEFKQIIGRGTRLFDGKDYFTIYDFVNAHHHFQDPEWDGEPLEPEPEKYHQPKPCVSEPSPTYNEENEGEEIDERRQMIKIKLADGKVRELQHMVKTSFYSPDGTPISAEEFLKSMFGVIPDLFKSEDELRAIWSKPDTRKKLLQELQKREFAKEQLQEFQKVLNAENSDLYDVLAYVAFHSSIMERTARAENAKINLYNYDAKQQEFLNFVLQQYVNSGVEELDDAKLKPLLELKYKALDDAKKELGDIASIRNTFIGFQSYLYQNRNAI